MNNKTNYYTSLALVFFSLGYFFYGFIVGENSAGAGGYTGDFLHVWKNLQVYLNNDLKSAIINEEYYSNRSPLAYIIHKFFNPLTNNQYNYRLSVFLITLLIPILLFLCLRLKYKRIDILLLSLVSSIILFSPYVRTSGYWALEENYGIISILTTYIFYNLFVYKKKNKIINLFFLVLFSSSCLYFDLKLTIIPLIIFISIIFSNEKNIHKLYMMILYFFFSVPYWFLIYTWGSIFSPSASKLHTLETGLYLDHLVYIVPVLSLYIFPFFFLSKNKFSFSELKKNLLTNFNIMIITLFLLILIYLQFFYEAIVLDFLDTTIGKGFIFKVGNMIFKEPLYQKIFFVIASLTSFIILLLYLKKKLNDWLIIFYIILLSLVAYPLLQEYYDPLILLMILLFFKTEINFKHKPVYLLYAYFLVMNIFANYYY